QALATPSEALTTPHAQSTVWLQAQPTPRQRRGHPAHMAVAGLGEPLFPGTVAALIWGPREARPAPDCQTVLEGAPAKKCPHHQPRPIDPNPFEPHQLASLVEPRVGRGLQLGTTLGFHRGNRLTEKRVLGLHA